MRISPLDKQSERIFYATLSVTVFIWLTAILIRTLHYWFEVPFSRHAIISSVLVQSSLSIFWTVLALCAMFVATRFKQRRTWMIGGVLLGIVLAKLFIIDLANTGTLARVVSFLGVGMLLVVLGYFSPAPPKVQEETPS